MGFLETRAKYQCGILPMVVLGKEEQETDVSYIKVYRGSGIQKYVM